MSRQFNILAILSLLTFVSASAQEASQELSGAFGITFGQEIPEALSPECVDKRCSFSPSDPVNYFEKYSASVTERNQKAYEIAAQGSPANYDACLRQGEEIARSVKQQYGVDLERKESKSEAGIISTQWAKDIGTAPKASYTEYKQPDNRKRIAIDCAARNSSSTISITYTDRFVLSVGLKANKRSLSGF